MRSKLSAAVIVLSCFAFSTASQATDGKTILLGLIGAAMKKQAEKKAEQSQVSELPAELQAPKIERKSSLQVMWRTKEELLNAASEGAFSKLHKLSNLEGDLEPLTHSVINILQNEYGVPSIEWRNESLMCFYEARGGITDFLYTAISSQTSTLTDSPPEFIGQPNYNDENYLKRSIKEMEGGDACGTEIMGVMRPHPYIKALVNLSVELVQAVKENIEAERARRVSVYQTEQERRRQVEMKNEQEENRRIIEKRNTEQQKINEERAKVEAEQQRRQKIIRNRVSG